MGTNPQAAASSSSFLHLGLPPGASLHHDCLCATESRVRQLSERCGRECRVVYCIMRFLSDLLISNPYTVNDSLRGYSDAPC